MYLKSTLEVKFIVVKIREFEYGASTGFVKIYCTYLFQSLTAGFLIHFLSLVDIWNLIVIVHAGDVRNGIIHV